MKKLTKFFKTASFAANLAVAISLFFLIFKVAVLDQVPQWFPFGHEYGLAVDRLLGSIVVSYVFYILVVHLKEWRGKERLRPYIEKYARSIYGQCEGQLNELGKVLGQDLTLSTVTRDEVGVAFKCISPHSSAPLVLGQTGTPANW